MQSSFSLLDGLERDLIEQSSAELEAKYHRMAAEARGSQIADAIAALPIEGYRSELKAGLDEALDRANRAGAIVVNFEYDLQGSWGGWFFVCHEYATPEEGDDSWAKEYAEEVRGPILERFAEIHREHGSFADSPRFAASLYLIARLAEILRGLAAVAPHPRIGICMGYHKQDPIWRLREPHL